jgi:hypothetical protein
MTLPMFITPGFAFADDAEVIWDTLHHGSNGG